MIDIALLATAFVTLFVIVDPFGLVPVFIALTEGQSVQERRAIAIRSLIVAAVLLAIFGGFGESVLNFIGISMAAFRISGGILLFLTAFDMLFERRTKRRKGQAAAEHDPSVFPIAMPLIAGPGSMTTVILLSDQLGSGFVGFATLMGVVGAVLICVFITFLLAPAIERALGKTGMVVVTRLLGMLLAALSVQFMIDGLIEAFSSVGRL
ncbi:MAG: MarC family protein [Halocynthiibacter sp.]